MDSPKYEEMLTLLANTNRNVMEIHRVLFNNKATSSVNGHITAIESKKAEIILSSARCTKRKQLFGSTLTKKAHD
ncbi:hypothetical protein HDC90_004992 [Pedobacter sp. AK013]|uniref:hypothetical protein n=1 Tax=Pedobacter sp. AK013 TaxID=2723071 RepID=UPI0016071D61|nr:hypothetical protein [Pedobacter sp. AK013]MBB6240318.1 hypothetical protein [Pedobacter sp. AK013]